MAASPIIAVAVAADSSSSRDRTRCRRRRRSCCCGSSRRSWPTGSACRSAPRVRPLDDARADRCCGGRRARPGATSRRSSPKRTRWLPPDNFQEAGDDAAAGAPHVADQHRHEPAVDARRARPGLPLDRRAARSASIATLTTLEGLERYRGPLPELVRHGDAGAAAPALRLDGRQRQPRRRADRARAGAARSSTTRPQTRAQRLDGLADTADLLAAASSSSAGRLAPRHDRRRRSIGWRAPSSRRARDRSADDVVAALAGARRASSPARRPRSTGRSRPTPATTIALLVPGRRRRGRSTSAVERAGVRRRRCGRSPTRVSRARRRHAVRLPLRPPAAHLLDRLPPGRRRRPGRLDGVVLRPAGVGGAARQLRRDRQGRRPAAPLVPPRTPGHERRRPRDADVVGRHDVRVPDAAAADAELPGHAARSELPRERAAPDRLRPRSAACRGASRSRPTRSPIAPATISTGRSACPASDSSAAWPTTS